MNASIQIKKSYEVVAWLSLEQVKLLLERGELTLGAGVGTVCLSIQAIDRIAAQELLKKAEK